MNSWTYLKTGFRFVHPSVSSPVLVMGKDGFSQSPFLKLSLDLPRPHRPWTVSVIMHLSQYNPGRVPYVQKSSSPRVRLLSPICS